jgi:BirA family biotin operon repressor/biotin-[acetyl-CoA-carboxylase] ligase
MIEKLRVFWFKNTLRETNIKSTIIGIGLNVNQSIFPIDIPNPTSLSLLTDTLYDIQELLALLSSRLEFYYLKLKKRSTCNFDGSISKSFCIEKMNGQFFRDDKDYIFKGKIIGIDTQGRLKIELEDDRLQVFGFREISFVF